MKFHSIEPTRLAKNALTVKARFDCRAARRNNTRERKLKNKVKNCGCVSNQNVVNGHGRRAAGDQRADVLCVQQVESMPESDKGEAVGPVVECSKWKASVPTPCWRC